MATAKTTTTKTAAAKPAAKSTAAKKPAAKKTNTANASGHIADKIQGLARRNRVWPD